MQKRYAYQSLLQFSSDLFVASGLSLERANTMAWVLLEADLMGFTTHGMNRISTNLQWIEDGTTRLTGEPEILADHGNVFNWDAGFLPGPWVLSNAIEQAIQRVKQRGIISATIRRSQHIACLAAYLPKIIDAGYVGFITCSTPSENTVSPFAGIKPVFSTTPIAFCAPADDEPLLFDLSTSITAGGYVKRAAREGKLLDEACLKDNKGNISNDPLVYFADPPGSIMPIGGATHGYKGYALTIMNEVLSMALAGYGRASNGSEQDGEANSIYLQLIDPAAFTSLELFKQQINELKSLSLNSGPVEPDQPVRFPGQRAWQLRRQQLSQGVTLYPTIMQDLAPWAEKFQQSMPEPLN